MAKLKDRVQNALDEARMLVLGTELLIGFHYRSAFESGFDQDSSPLTGPDDGRAWLSADRYDFANESRRLSPDCRAGRGQREPSRVRDYDFSLVCSVVAGLTFLCFWFLLPVYIKKRGRASDPALNRLKLMRNP